MTGGLNQSQLAQALKVSRTMVTNYKKQGKITPDENGLYDLEATKQELARNLRPRKDGRPGVVSRQASEDDPANEGSLAQEQLRLTRERRIGVQMENRKRGGQLVEIEEVEKIWSAHIEVVQRRLLLMPTVIASKVAAVSAVSECHAIIEAEVRLALSELSGGPIESAA